ncbi:protein FAM171A1 [Trichomycterus rosablanca]|uniref:protein FAM171A1 n=1 Tax=Trichomycterus rosablanca TaxID=2290929 RepID=UPI002F3520FE
MRGSEISTSAVIVLCLLGCNVWKTGTEALREDSGTKEVGLKVHLSDASTHQPLSDATVELFANHTSIAKEISGADGNIFIRFPYRLGDLLVVTATRRGYVPNSVPWQPTRLPVFSSLSLNLLPERAATLMVYDDVVQIISGYQGSKLQPWVQFQRRALSLPPNATYTNLTAFLTVTHSEQDTQHFPYLQGLRANSTGSDHRFELTPVSAISVQLLGSDGAALQVSEPISVGIPLPANSGLKENDHIPAWRFDPKIGAWLKSSLGSVQKEGGELILTYIAPQLGYWVAAMSPINTGPVVEKDISRYHTVFLLAILGGMALILLFLLCLLLCYCRRKCSRPRRAHQKYSLSSALDSSKRDQATSMSNLNLISETQLDPVVAEPDLHTPMLMAVPHRSSTTELVLSQDEFGSRSQREYRRSYNSVISSVVHPLHASVSSSSPYPLHHTVSAGRLSSESKASPRNRCLSQATTVATASPDRDLGVEHRPSDYMLSRSVDQLERPALLPRPGELICCTSELQVSHGGASYQKGRPTLLIPAHYMRLPGTHPLSGQALLLQSDERSELESIQAELNASHQLQADTGQGESEVGVEKSKEGPRDAGGTANDWTLQTAALPEALSIPTSLSNPGLGVVQMNGEDQLLAEKTLMKLRGGKPLAHPRAWFVSLDGRSNAHIRHSYIDLQRAGHGVGSAGSNDASLDSGVDVSDVTPGRRGKVKHKAQVVSPAVASTPLVFVDNNNAKASASDNSVEIVNKPQTPVCSPEDNSLTPSLPNTKVEEECLEPSSPPLLPTPPVPSSPPLPSPPPLPDPTLLEDGDERVDDDTFLRNEHALAQLKLPSSNSAPDGLAVPDDNGEEENKKSPWQKREERPLLAFNLK